MLFIRIVSSFSGHGRSFLLSWALFFVAGIVFSQPIIRGKITGRDGIALPGATVAIKGTNNISSTDSAGHFIIRANPGNTIEFSFIGYYNQQIKLGNQTELDISLTGTIVNLNDVVVIGYGTAKKKDLTGCSWICFCQRF